MKKRLLIIALALSLVFVLSSCGLRDVVGEKDSSGKNDTTQTDDNSSGGSILPDNSTDGDASLDTPSVDDEPDSDEPDDYDTSDFGDSVINYTYPYGWTAEELSDYNVIYYNPNYPTDGSNINLIITQPDPTLKNYSQSEFEETFLSTLQNTDLAGIDISFDYFEKGTLDGYDTLYFEASYDYMGIAMVQYQYYIVVPGDCTYILTFTQAGDNNWTPEFDEMIDSIYIS